MTVSSPKSVPSTSSNSMLPSFWRITYAHTSRVTAFNEASVLKTSSITEDVLFSSKIWPTKFKKVDFPTRAFPTAAITRIGRSICDISFKTSSFNSNLNAFGELLSFTERSRILACCASVTITKPESERSVPKAIRRRQIMIHSLLFKERSLINKFVTPNHLFGETTWVKHLFKIHEITFGQAGSHRVICILLMLNDTRFSLSLWSLWSPFKDLHVNCC